jgi:UDP-N-acetyl-D-mannosaminuronate dehydrogenase
VKYWEEKEVWVNQDLDELLKDSYDIIAITTGHKEYRDNDPLIDALINKPASFIYDTIGVLTNEEIKKLSARHVVKVIGRGDL